ncbi:SDR family NAD(P)-dependent oxidoreductase [Virgibacillus sp. C22-A2]|uniref:SDR family NAD(P)-dependent oxidoreductase n=1 Tax=Virgibacillus tibetensis TaxID=3042313 RepID=A0ABU6KGD6_9BACI|nr:SDR family NAD(P)-dependent oxidoreductase [Virgibacillus sp. C22-A2]
MFFEKKKILITGGTGTIGKSIVNYLIKENPDIIKIFSRDEYKQQQLQKETGNQETLRFIIGDIRDYESLEAAMHDIDYVFHLAAMKRVESCEYNPYEAIKTNVYGTNNVIKAARAQKVKKVIFTSSDKAISPTNTYGATKMIGERLISVVEYSKKEGQTIFSSVRFGNVMGSRGSVIPLFKERIFKEKKIEVTDRGMTRFMMTLDQATELTIKALKEAMGGEVFVLKMPVVNLGDLADILVEETCKIHQLQKSDIEIEIMGLRPGEKMYEELMTYDESTSAWELPSMYIIPGFSGKVTNRNAKVASTGIYSSMSQQPIGMEELRSLLKAAKLI